MKPNYIDIGLAYRDWLDHIAAKNGGVAVYHERNAYKAGAEWGMEQVGWHPGTEKPKAQNDRGDICHVFIITEDGDFGERLYYDENDIDMTNIRWWIYPPEEK